MTTTLKGCSFSNTTSNGDGGGGGVSVYYGSTATDVTTTLTGCSFFNTTSNGILERSKAAASLTFY